VASFLTAALSLQTAVADLSDVVLPSQTRLAIEGLIEEYRHQEAFRAQGLRRRSKVIFHGPPGCGKTMAAKALANALGLPAYVVRFDAVVGSYLGQTAANLRQLFQFAEARQAVVVFDEVDALGKRRGSPSDVGELDRIVIALMQELELSVIQGVIVATSNLASSLDEALWRRFDLVVKFPAPSRNALQRFAKAKAKAYGVPTAALARGGLGGAKSFADAERAVEDLARRRLLGALRK
jgi:SpoVK/Ycf46/Vps4 family AAA+-type ATPase